MLTRCCTTDRARRTQEERGDDVDVAVYAKAWEAARADLQFVPSRNAYVSSAELTEAEVLEAQRHELGRLTGFLAKVVRHCSGGSCALQCGWRVASYTLAPHTQP